MNNELRGCIGVMSSDKPLIETIVAMSLSASFEDPRFPPLAGTELPHVTFEISLISQPVVISRAEQIVAGQDGVVVSAGRRRALLLPQVASQIGGTAGDFLDAACRKAGLPAGAWQLPGTRIETFRAEVFAEEH